MVALEGLVLVGLGIVELFSLRGERLAMGLSTAAFFLAGGVGLALCAWGLLRARRAARGPVIMTQLVALGLAWNFRVGETRIYAVILVVAAAVVLWGMLNRRSVAALEQTDASG